MEINARVYAIADSEGLLERVQAALRAMDEDLHIEATEVLPNAILPLMRPWQGFRAEVALSSPDDAWRACLLDCAQTLKQHGAVIVDFWSPDHPDDYSDSIHTLSGGGVREGKRCMLAGYRRALGADDIRLVYRELVSGRSQCERDVLAQHKQRREDERREKGEFEVVNGVLVKYRGSTLEARVPKGVKGLGAFAFVDQLALEDMLLRGREYIAPKLRRLILPDGLRKIGTRALAYCTDLRDVRIPDSVAEIEARAFEGCKTLERLEFPIGITEIAEGTLYLCDGLRSVAIPKGVTRIGAGAFSGCCRLMHVKLPDGVRVIEKEAFRNCGKLKKIEIPEGVTEIGASAFEGCAALERVTLPQSLRYLGADAFKGCRALREINRPEGLEAVDEGAFDG